MQLIRPHLHFCDILIELAEVDLFLESTIILIVSFLSSRMYT
jgi:hypothetical protein